MRPALQKLLSRPTSLELLRTLVGTPTVTIPNQTKNRDHDKRGYKKKSGTAATATNEPDDRDHHIEKALLNPRNKIGRAYNIPLVTEANSAEELLKAGDNFISVEAAEEDSFNDHPPGRTWKKTREPPESSKREDELGTLDRRHLCVGENSRGKKGQAALSLGQTTVTRNTDATSEFKSATVPSYSFENSSTPAQSTTSPECYVDLVHDAQLGLPELHPIGNATRFHKTLAEPDSFALPPKLSPIDTQPHLDVPCWSLEPVNVYHPPSNQTMVPRKDNPFGPWEEILSNHDALDFESSLDSPTRDPNKRRLVDTEAHKDDVRLWAYLLTYRKRVYGSEGVLMFWNSIRTRELRLGRSLILGDIFWPAFLSLGFADPYVLQQVCNYADKMLHTWNERWPGLYSNIVQHFLLEKDGRSAIRWHKRLFAHHPPGSHRFARMCRKVAYKGGDMEALKSIYNRAGYKNVYSHVIPTLCSREHFKAALDWHYIFLKQGDLPSSAKLTEPLVRFLAIYYPRQAKILTKSLVDAGASFSSTLPEYLEPNTKISREMMNLLHGQDLNVSPKKYNDSLGARWFATSWVSFDTAITTVHALGVREIGPLSLHAIALRNPDPKIVAARIRQLRDLGISIGISLFSRAVKYFAEHHKSESLKGLLHSDQHPDELENAELQEALLATYAQSKDWAKYRRTLEIQSLTGKSPEFATANIILRSIAITGNSSAISNQLQDMQLQRVPVSTASVRVILLNILHRRRPGKRPVVRRGEKNRGASNDLNSAIVILKRIMASGSHVPATQWREIIKRLGMLGEFGKLQDLCIYLAHRYGPKNIPRSNARRIYRVPAELPTNHPLHPLNVLFSPSIQASITEWGFIAALKRYPTHFPGSRKIAILPADPSSLPDFVVGIKLLRNLAKLGVHVNGPTVRKAIFNRLIAYFGPGRSQKKHNRWGQKKLAGRIAEVAEKIDAALGAQYFSSPDIDLSARVQIIAVRRMEVTIRSRMKLRGWRPELDPMLPHFQSMKATLPQTAPGPLLL